jgi:ribonuclease E
MSKEIYISSTPHETRLAIVENDALTEIYYERENEYTLAGSIYNGKVTRVLPGMQSSFVDIGLERDAFLYITDFMEEAGDSADFEATNAGEGRSRGGNRERSGNRDQAALPAPEAVATAAIEDTGNSGDRSSSDQASSERSSSDRSGRDRGGRGRRDRNRSGNRDRGPRLERTENTPQPLAAEPNFNTAEVDFSGQPSFPEANGLPDRLDSDLGEGAPGADGSRRWRGRRGRRRGRGDTLQAGDIQVNETDQRSSPATYDDEFASTSYIDANADEGSVKTPAAPRNTAPIASAYGDTTERETVGSSDQRSDRPDQPNRDRDRAGRGGRNRSRNRGPRPDGNTVEARPSRSEDRAPRGEDHSPRTGEDASRSEDRGGRSVDRSPRNDDRGGRDRGPRVPRGFAPKVALYGVDSTPPYGQPAYGDAPEAPAGEPIILPGESLSKYRKGEEASAVAKPAFTAETIVLPVASGFTVSSDWDGGAVLPGETLSRNRRPEGRSEGRRSEPSASHRPDSRNDTRVAMRVAATPAPAPVAPVEVATREYEPTEASASYRIDPVAQSEFRQSASVAEPEQLEIVATHSEPAAEVTKPEDDWDWQQPVATKPVGAPAADITTLQSSGEMLSVAPAIEPTETPAPKEIAQPTEPILHETAIVSPVHIEGMEEEVVPGSGGGIGDGKVEEDSIDALHASAIEEMDDFDEEETLEGAADLGTMIREMSIDQITSPADAEADADLESDSEEEDYEDFEEEDSVDEHLASEADSEESNLEADSGSSYDAESDSESDARRFAEVDADSENGLAPSGERSVSGESSTHPAPREGDRDRSRRRDGGRRDGRGRDARSDGRRDGRSDTRSDSRDRDRSRNTGGAGDRERSGRSRQSMQSTNLPAISDLLKPGQEVLVQIAKEPIAKKGARITSHIALPGRFLVFMPTVNHTGVSRKIESDTERRRLKEILLSEKGEASGGFIVRTAAAGASEEELRSDLRFLLNLWTDIKTRSESSKSPALIYHDLNLVERILRDQVTDNFSAIWVDTESDYERILRFLQRFQPSLIRRVKLYTKETPLFEQFGITEEINKALRSKVWLKSGGSIVINQTEALVAIDINTGKFVGKTARLEDTIVKTNLDAIPEIVRQIRLRDLGGIIIIDFIDMDERKNRNRVMAALEDELKSDRAPSKVLQFNDFGLVAITRKRVKQSLERTLSTTCNVCVGTGMVKSPITVCNDIYIEMRKMHKNLDRGDVMLRVHPEVVKALKSPTSKWLQEMEEMCGRTILVKSDPALHPEQFDIH